MATSSTLPAAQTHKRRWYQFSLRAVLIFVLVVSIPLGWFARRLDRARRQKAAVAAIWKAEGWVGYDFSRDLEGVWPRHYTEFNEPVSVEMAALESCGESWIRDYLGTDFAYQAEVVSFSKVYPTRSIWMIYIKPPIDQKLFDPYETGSDARLALLKPLSVLREIYTCGPEVTDTGLVHLTGFAHLEYLGLSHTSVTDEGLKHLQSMTQLRHLYLSNSKVTTRGVERLRQSLPNCDIEFE